MATVVRVNPATRAADAACRAYQRHLSPRKRWACAHRVHHGGDSCSGAVRTLLLQRGLLGALAPTAGRFLACYRAAAALRALGAVPGPAMAGGAQGVCCCGPIPIPFRF